MIKYGTENINLTKISNIFNHLTRKIQFGQIKDPTISLLGDDC